MKKPQKRIIVSTLLLAIGVASITACGQKGPLRLPSPALATSPTPSAQIIHTNL